MITKEHAYIGEYVHALQRSGTVCDFWNALDRGKDASLAVVSIARPFLVASYYMRTGCSNLCLLASEDSARIFSRSLKRLVGEERVLDFPILPLCEKADREEYAECVAQRNEVLWYWYQEAKRESGSREQSGDFKGADVPVDSGSQRSGDSSNEADGRETANAKIVVASVAALIDYVMPVESKAFAPFVVRLGDDFSETAQSMVSSFDDFLQLLQQMGFCHMKTLDGPGTFCVHGGTVDIFPGNEHNPYRIEFFGDEVDGIHRLLPQTGQTITSLDSCEIFPVLELCRDERMFKRLNKNAQQEARYSPEIRALLDLTEITPSALSLDAMKYYAHGRLSNVMDFVSPQTLCCIIEPKAVVDAYAYAFEEKKSALKDNTLCSKRLSDSGMIDIEQHQSASYLTLVQAGHDKSALLKTSRIDPNFYSDVFFEKLHGLVDKAFVVVCSVNGEKMRQEFSLMLVDRHLPFSNYQPGEALHRGQVCLTTCAVPGSFILPDAKLAFVNFSSALASADLALTKRIDITEVTFPFAPGDYVVHAVHGIALFANLVRRELEGIVRDYLELEYAGGDKVFVPVEQLDRVTRYVGPSSAKPALTRLNTTDWSKTVKKARRSTKKLAFDLLDVYLRRSQVKGYEYAPNSCAMDQLVDSFPYTETPDQLRALKEIYEDMESSLPMDRLLCGDVGFGKTEVALRCAFKAVDSGKQVFILCPTTILAQQHYETFSERLSPFGVRIDVLSRFRTTAQKKDTLEALSEGKVDILIGTHRLLSSDVNPKDLGLVIIDEEQRFGVAHKERFKHMRESLDVLALSATPIPRTLQMSLTGVRNMSLITTPPDNRKAVEVFVGEWDEEIVTDAISKEIARGGQVYYVSNRVQTIEGACMRVARCVPDARIGVVHGQLSKQALESIMEDFAAREIDVLIATSIIESGIDNPFTNTLIIEDSQRLGLSQMYQLKGRVGRSSVQAYAYFMYPQHANLTEEASGRLMALFEHQDLGSGMKIAMRDLEIRGAGNILGAEQSGNLSGVGFDLFSQMLQEALISANQEVEGIPNSGRDEISYLSDVSINLDESSYLSEDLIPDIDKRVVAYRRLASAATVGDVISLKRKVEDEWGDLDEAALNCFDRAQLRAFAAKRGIRSIYVSMGKVVVEPLSQKQFSPERARRLRWLYSTTTGRLKIPLKLLPETGQSLAMRILVSLEANVR